MFDYENEPQFIFILMYPNQGVMIFCQNVQKIK